MTQEREPEQRRPRREAQPQPQPQPEQAAEPIDIGEQVGVAIERLKKRDLKQTALIAFVIGVLFHACVIYAVLGSGGGGTTSPPLRGVVDANGTPRATATATPSINRKDCGAITGTQYRSDEERTWFLANCKPG